MLTFDEKLQHIFALAGAVVTLLSAVSSLLNHIIRRQTDSGQTVGKGLLTAGSVLNFASVNLDKAVQFGKMAKNGQDSVPQTVTVQPVAPPTEPKV